MLSIAARGRQEHELATTLAGWKIERMNIGRLRKRKSPALLAAACFAVLVPACAQEAEEDPPTSVPDEVYVQVMTELMLLDARPPKGGSADERAVRADSIRTGILSSNGVTAEEILAFAETLGSDADRMESLWQEITQRYDSARAANLKATTEAQSEMEGKLGAEAGTGTQSTSPADAASGRRSEVKAAPVDSARVRDILRRARRFGPAASPAPEKPARDTTPPPD